MKTFDKDELLNKIDGLTITKENNTVTTSYFGKVIKAVGVSDIYEVFDFTSYVTKVIDVIDDTFDIQYYDLIIKGGIQQIRLFSDTVEIGGKTFFKAIYILNSSDRSRKLNVDFGLYSKTDSTSLITKGSSLIRKHVKGITDKVNETIDLDPTGFNEVITSLQNLENKSIKMSKVEKVVLKADEDGVVLPSNFLKLDSLKRMMNSNMTGFSADEVTMLLRKSENFNFGQNGNGDFEVDAFEVVMNYMRLFKARDSYTIKRESGNILEVTKEVIRSRNLQSILG